MKRAKEPTVTVGADELLWLTGSEYCRGPGSAFTYHGVVEVALNALDGAAADLRVLGYAANSDVDGDWLHMVMIRMANRLEAVSTIVERELRANGSRKVSETNGSKLCNPEDCPLADCPMREGEIDHEAALREEQS